MWKFLNYSKFYIIFNLAGGTTWTQFLGGCGYGFSNKACSKTVQQTDYEYLFKYFLHDKTVRYKSKSGVVYLECSVEFDFVLLMCYICITYVFCITYAQYPTRPPMYNSLRQLGTNSVELYTRQKLFSN